MLNQRQHQKHHKLLHCWPFFSCQQLYERPCFLFLFWSQLMFRLNVYENVLNCVFGWLLFVWFHEDGVFWLMDRIQDISDRQLLIALKSRAAIRAQQWAHCALGLVTCPPNPNTVAVWDSINFYWGHKCECTMKLCWDEGKETKLAV